MERQYRGPDRVIDGFPQPNSYSGPFPAEQHIRIRQNYGAMIENIDRWLGIYQDRLRQRGELDNTIVVYSSDHGEMLGDHSKWGKSMPYQASAGVPLVMAGPGIAREARSDALVTLTDIAATFLDYMDVKVPAEMQSRTLRPLLDAGGGDHREHTRSALITNQAKHGRWRMVQDQRYKLVEGFFEHRALFDREADPLETRISPAASRARPRGSKNCSRTLEDNNWNGRREMWTAVRARAGQKPACTGAMPFTPESS